MDTTGEMLKSSPNAVMTEDGPLVACIAACDDCARACIACADACLGEKMVDQLRRCIRLNLDCADVCEVTARLLLRQFEPERDLIRRQVELCALACRVCADECTRHAKMHAHCRICAEACRRCADSCDDLLKTMQAH